MKGIGSTLKSSIGGLDTRAHYTARNPKNTYSGRTSPMGKFPRLLKREYTLPPAPSRPGLPELPPDGAP